MQHNNIINFTLHNQDKTPKQEVREYYYS